MGPNKQVLSVTGVAIVACDTFMQNVRAPPKKKTETAARSGKPLERRDVHGSLAKISTTIGERVYHAPAFGQPVCRDSLSI